VRDLAHICKLNNSLLLSCFSSVELEPLPLSPAVSVVHHSKHCSGGQTNPISCMAAVAKTREVFTHDDSRTAEVKEKVLSPFSKQ